MATIQTKPDEKPLSIMCSICGSTATFLERTQWGLKPRWYGALDKKKCKNCYERNRWQRYIPKNAKCARCKSVTTAISRYGTPIWVRDENRVYCKACFVIIRDKGQIRPEQARNNVKLGIHAALERGVIFGKKKYSLDESVFDILTEKALYWIGFLMTDGWISKERTGNPRIGLVLAEKDYGHLVKFSKFLKCTNPILPKNKRYHGMIVIQYILRFSSMYIAEKLYGYGIVKRKSLIARFIGLENLPCSVARHLWRGVFDGDGYFKNKDGIDGDKMVLTGSNDLCAQYEQFIHKNVPEAKVTIRKTGKYSKLHVYSNTARALARLLYYDCNIALERKLAKARKMYCIS